MASWLSSGDARAFTCLLALAVMYGAMSYLADTVIHTRHVRPLGSDAPPNRFSEARAIEHIRHLTVDIDGRQEGRPGLEEAAKYIRKQLEALADRAGPNYRVEIEETLVSGSFNMIFLRHSISVAYRSHKNVLMRISSNFSNDLDPSVLVNGHYDSPLGSPGAGDCGSCVASMLELARLIIDSKWIPPRPIIFLFNGAEELFLLGSHGFVKTHKWSNTIGAFINIEASGTGGLDLVCQSGPGSWPSHVYAQSAQYPMANSVAQDVFGIIPGDTDYRIFAKDYGDIPGLDIIFVLGGYFYHTSYDTLERLLPGSIQARGENLFSLIDAFASSSMVLNANGRTLEVAANGAKTDQAIFFDYLSWFMIFYSRKVSMVLHSLPLVIFLLMPLFLWHPNSAMHSWFATFSDFLKGMLFHAISVVLAIIIPVVFAVLRLLFSSHAMSWFAHPFLAFLMFVPSSLVGLFLPMTIWGFFPVSQDTSRLPVSKHGLSDEARFWGAFGLYAVITFVYLLAGLGGGFLTYLISISMLLAWFSFYLVSKHCGHQSLKSLAGFVVPLIPCLTYVVYYGAFLIQFLVEKMGMMGSLPQPYDANKIVDSSYEFSVVDANSLAFLFKYAPEAAKMLRFSSEMSFEEGYHSDSSSWVALFPVSFLFSGSLKFPAQADDVSKHYRRMPYLSLQEPVSVSASGLRRVHLELYLGSLEEIWVTVLNITGPLSNWSFADNRLPAPETVSGGPPSYICRLSGRSHENWTFWLEANRSETLRVDVAVLDQYLLYKTKKLKNLFPSWADVTAFTTFLSSYSF